jgi:hypothetical protein
MMNVVRVDVVGEFVFSQVQQADAFEQAKQQGP